MSAIDALIDEELEALEQLALEDARDSLLGFIVYLNDGFDVNWHHRVLCNALEEMMLGTQKRVLISLPPGHSKSEIVSRYFPAYLMGKNPDTRILACSYNSDLASGFNRNVQRIIDSEEYHRVFPETRLSGNNVKTSAHGSTLRNSDMFEIVGHKGFYKSAGVGAGLTGRRGDWLIQDDLLRDWADASSPTILAKQWDWYRSTFRTRVAKDARIVGVMTRWSHADVFGLLIDLMNSDPTADQWHVINIPAINEDGPSDIDPRQIGEALWPKFFPIEELQKIKGGLGTRIFTSLYQGHPTPGEGSILKSGWFQSYLAVPQRFEKIIIAADLTFSDSKRGDWNAWQVWGKVGAKAYLLDRVRARQDFNEQCRCLKKLTATWYTYHEVIIENAANGAALVNAMKGTVPKVVPVPAKGSKESRVSAISPLIEAGNVYLPHPSIAPWVDELLDEVTTFPHGRTDDETDAMTHALMRLFPPRPSYKNLMPMGIGKQSLTTGLV